jgi:pimeloyl-ACP methyl ester carboxylesterase
MPYVAINDTTIHYEWVNDSCKRNGILVFLHEALGSIGQWKNFPEALCQSVNMAGLVYERQGHGQSEEFTEPRTADYLHRYAHLELPGVLGSLSISEPVILVGHSDGGSIGLLFAAAYPERVKALICMAAHVFVEEETLAGIEPAKSVYETKIRERLRKYHPKQVDALFYAWADTWQSTAFRNWNITGELERITCPVLVIQGDEDEYGTVAQVEAIVSGCSGEAQSEIIQNCGHIPFLQQPDVTLKASRKFIEGLKQKSEP